MTKEVMNKRIKELAIEAGIYTNESKLLHKFAELIVKECAEVADTADATREKWQSVGKFVKEHFGVTHD